MNTVFTIIRGNIRKGKSSFISVLILTLFLTMTLTTVMSVSINSRARDEEALDEAGFGDFIAGVCYINLAGSETSDEKLKQDISNSSYVDSVKTDRCLFVNIDELNGKQNSSDLMCLSYDKCNIKYRIFTEDGNSLYLENPLLKKGEICVPYSFKDVYNCKIGDVIKIKTVNGVKPYNVKYFFEDPFMGTSTMGVKTLLLMDEDIELLSEEAKAAEADDIQKGVYRGILYNVYKSDKASDSSLKFVQEINNASKINEYTGLNFTRKQASEYMLFIVDIFCGVLIGFIVLLFIITIIIIGHSINTSIEQDYVNLGILKALGITKSILRTSFVLQYLGAACIGAVIGAPIAIPLIGLVNSITRPVLCLSVSNTIAWLECIAVIICLFVVVVLFTLLKVSKIGRIKPVRAIQGGRDAIHFSNVLQIKIRKRGLSVLLALRQLTSNIKQYISIIIITGILVFFLVIISGICQWMSGDDAQVLSMFNCFDGDISIKYYDTDLRDEIEERINKETEITGTNKQINTYLNINNCSTYCIIIKNSEAYNQVVEGRACKYDNEIMITKYVAKDLELKIGDKVEISIGNCCKEFIISGFYQCSSDLGNNFTMLTSGYKRLVENDIEDACHDIYTVADSKKINSIVEDLTKEYSKDQIKAQSCKDYEFIKPFVFATQGITIIIYVLSVVFSLICVILVCTKIFAKERIDNGIYKAVGFTTHKLRGQFGIRFAIVAAFGALLGVVISLLISNTVIKLVFSTIGFSDIHITKTFLIYIVPLVFMIILFYLFSFLIASRLKKINIRELITD